MQLYFFLINLKLNILFSEIEFRIKVLWKIRFRMWQEVEIAKSEQRHELVLQVNNKKYQL